MAKHSAVKHLFVGFLHLVEHPSPDVPVPDFVVRSVVSGQRSRLGRAGAEEWVETLPPAVRDAARAELAPKPRK